MYKLEDSEQHKGDLAGGCAVRGVLSELTVIGDSNWQCIKQSIELISNCGGAHTVHTGFETLVECNVKLQLHETSALICAVNTMPALSFSSLPCIQRIS